MTRPLYTSTPFDWRRLSRLFDTCFPWAVPGSHELLLGGEDGAERLFGNRRHILFSVNARR